MFGLSLYETLQTISFFFNDEFFVKLQALISIVYQALDDRREEVCHGVQ